MAKSPLLRYWKAKSPANDAKSPRFHFRPVTIAETKGWLSVPMGNCSVFAKPPASSWSTADPVELYSNPIPRSVGAPATAPPSADSLTKASSPPGPNILAKSSPSTKNGSPLIDIATPPDALKINPMLPSTTPARNAGVSKVASASVTATVISPPPAVPVRWKAKSPEILRKLPKRAEKPSAITTAYGLSFVPVPRFIATLNSPTVRDP